MRWAPFLLAVSGCVASAPRHRHVWPATTGDASEVNGVLRSRGGALGDFDVPITHCAQDHEGVVLSDDEYATVTVAAWEGEAWQGLLPFDPDASPDERAQERDRRIVLTLRVTNLDPRRPRRDVYVNELSCDAFVGYARSEGRVSVGGFRMACATRDGGELVGSVVYRCAD